MIWLTGIICFAIGMCVGAILFRQLMSDTVRVKQLEEKLAALQSEHEEYKQSVHNHFTTTARLFHNLTDSYRDVYNHLASGAQALCPDNVSNQLAMEGENRELLADRTAGRAPEAASEAGGFTPPLDYAQRSDPAHKGNLAEDYGLHKTRGEPSA